MQTWKSCTKNETLPILRVRKDGQMCTERTKDWWMSEYSTINLNMKLKWYVKSQFNCWKEYSQNKK